MLTEPSSNHTEQEKAIKLKTIDTIQSVFILELKCTICLLAKSPKQLNREFREEHLSLQGLCKLC